MVKITEIGTIGMMIMIDHLSEKLYFTSVATFLAASQLVQQRRNFFQTIDAKASQRRNCVATFWGSDAGYPIESIIGYIKKRHSVTTFLKVRII